MADIIAPILNIVSVFCSCSANNRCFYLLGLQENKDALHTAMEELKATRDDVKRKIDEAENNQLMQRTKVVDNWLQSAQNIEDEVGEILTKVDQEIKGRCFGGNFPINCRSARKIGKLVLQKLQIVNGLKSKGDSFGEVAYKLPPPSVQEEPTNTTVGMESMFDKVWRLLAEDEVRIMGLYGYGGVGKTTLLKQINNAFLKPTTITTSSSNNTHGFDVVILVVVSKEIDIVAIQKEIWNRLGLKSLGLLSPDSRSIFMALKKKNFLLLLDDIWKRVDLQSIGVPPPSKNKKSKVVFTTRSEIVCGNMDSDTKIRVECLPWDKAWSLFEGRVGERALNSFQGARELAEVVARECCGLPLALITIGRAMAAKKTLHEWNDAITTLQKYASEFPGMGDEVLPILKVSYDNLSNDMIKSCFLYCALFPDDEYINKSKLIDYWIGEDLISLSEFSNNLDEARNKGYGVIGELKGASLLESGRDEETQVKMHDTIRDLALWIAHDCGNKRDKMFTIKTSDFTTPERSSSWYNNAERIYLIPTPHYARATEEVRSPPSPLKSPNLITLIPSGLSVLPQKFFEFTPLLRVLDLSHIDMETFPTSITELLELRYLSLSGTRIQVLPEELGKLVKLNFLDLSHMKDLKKIPSGVISSLLELRVLNLYRCYKLVDWDIEEVDQLKHLNDLGITIINTEHLTKLLSSSNKNLQMCTRHLILDNFLLFDKFFSYQILFDETPKLRRIPMGIEQQQQHLGSSCFQNLIQIEVWYCNGLKDLTWVGYVPNLNTLSVYFCEELEEILTKLRKIDIFKSLKTLQLWGLPKLKSICRNALAFPCLKSLEVYNCQQLKKLPFDSGSNPNNTLQRIAGGPKWWSELQWEEDHNNNNNNNNNNNELLKSKFLPYFEEHSIYD